MKQKAMKEIVGVAEAIKYVESLDENTRIISHTISDMVHYIITETEVKHQRKPQSFNRNTKQRLEEWFTEHNVTHNQDTNTFIRSEVLVNDFNEWNDSKVSGKVFIPLFKEVCSEKECEPEQVRALVEGKRVRGFKCITINGHYDKLI